MVTIISVRNKNTKCRITQTFINRGCFPLGDATRHKYRSIFVTYRMPKETKRYLCRLVSLNGKHSIIHNAICCYMYLLHYFI